MKEKCLILMLSTLFFGSLWACENTVATGDTIPVSHRSWDVLLQRHVKENGFVDYKGMQRDSVELNHYLTLLSAAQPNAQNWTRNEKMAFWINAYNAFTVKLIIDHYPVESIKDIKRGIPFVNTVWDIKFIKIGGKTYDLNNIEHGILRPAAGSHRLPALGRYVWLVPGHCDPTVNLHDFMIGVTGGLRSGKVERLIRVDARGALT